MDLWTTTFFVDYTYLMLPALYTYLLVKSKESKSQCHIRLSVQCNVCSQLPWKIVMSTLAFMYLKYVKENKQHCRKYGDKPKPKEAKLLLKSRIPSILSGMVLLCNTVILITVLLIIIIINYYYCLLNCCECYLPLFLSSRHCYPPLS